MLHPPRSARSRRNSSPRFQVALQQRVASCGGRAGVRSYRFSLVGLLLVIGLAAGCGGSLNGNTPEERAIAAGKLGINGADDNLPILAKAVEQEPEVVQLQAVQAMGRIGTLAAVTSLEKFMTHESKLIRIGVAQALQDVLVPSYPEAARVLVKMGERARPNSPSDDPFREERRAIVTSLAVLQQPVALDYLIERARTDHDQNIHEAAARTLGRLKDPRAVDLLIDSYHKDNERIRALVIEALGAIGDPRGLPVVREAFTDRDAVTRGKAAWSLMQLEGKGAIPVLRQAVNVEQNDLPAVVMAHALALLGETDAVPLLEDRLLNASNEMARAEAGRSLAEVGRLESFAVVDKAFNEDRDGLVKREAGIAARKLLERYPQLADGATKPSTRPAVPAGRPAEKPRKAEPSPEPRN